MGSLASVGPGSQREALPQRVRARARAGAHGTYTVIARGLHGVALRAQERSLIALPRAKAWLGPVSDAIEHFPTYDRSALTMKKALR